MPEKWSGTVAYMLEEIKKPKDTSKIKKTDTIKANVKDTLKKAKNKPKKVSKKNGYHVVVRNLESETQDTIKYVLSYTISNFRSCGFAYLGASCTWQQQSDWY